MSNAIEAGGAHAGPCANCGAALAGPFCGRCGQRAHLHRSIGDVAHEVLHGITHFDGRFWTTLPMLLFRPGQLTRSYIDGQRARYIAPVPLFLMVVFLMFFVLSFVQLPGDAIEIGGDATPAQRQAELKRSLADIERDLAAAEKTGDKQRIAELKRAQAGFAALAQRAADPDASTGDLVRGFGEGIIKASEQNNLTIISGYPELDRKAREALKNPSLMLYKLQSKAYKLSFLLVPLSLPWLWLAFFWRRDIALYDHAVFALYSISFISLLFVTGSLLLTAGVTAGWVWLGILLAPVAHIFVQLRGAYAIGWWGAGWRTLYLVVAAILSLSLYLVILVVLGVLD